MIDFGGENLDGGHDLFPEGASAGDMLRQYHDFETACVAEAMGKYIPPRDLVLVVEDDPDFAILMERRLKKHFSGFEIHVLDRAEDLITFVETQAYSRKRIAALITDINLPIMSGTNLVRVLNGSEVDDTMLSKEAVADFRAPVFLHSTTDPDHPHVQHVMRKGYAHGFLPKIPEPEVLTHVFRRGLTRAMRIKSSTRDGKKSE